MDYLYCEAYNRHRKFIKVQPKTDIKVKSTIVKDLFIEENAECGVCLQKQDLYPGFYNCNHSICKDCYKSWTKKTCPLCRSN